MRKKVLDLPDAKPIQSVLRATQIIDLFDEGRLELSLGEIAAVLTLNKSTAYGIIRTLEQRGYLAQDPISRCYHLGTRFISRSLCATSSLQIISQAAPYLMELRSKYQFATNLFLWERGELLCVYALGSDSLLSAKTAVGSTVPLFTSASGKARAAAFTPDELTTAMERHGISGGSDLPFFSQIEQIRAQGYALEDQEIKPGIGSIAALLRSPTAVVGTVSVTGSIQRLNAQLDNLSVDLMMAASRISAQLGTG